MPSGTCEVLPPVEATPVDGSNVYRCQGIATAINDTDDDLLYNVSIVFMDSVGNRRDFNQADIVATAGGSSSSGPFAVDLDAGLYNSGDVITFTGQMTLTAGLSASDRKSNQLTIV